ncbi:MAG: hypothetical protein ACEPOV_14385 [Hyphomicrobiales bacterium]
MKTSKKNIDLKKTVVINFKQGVVNNNRSASVAAQRCTFSFAPCLIE